MSDGSLIFRTSPRDTGIDIFTASGQVDPALRIFAADGSLVEAFPLGGGIATLPINLAGGAGVVTGVLPAANVDMTGNIIKSPAVLGRNTILPTANSVDGIVVKSHSTAQSAPLIDVRDANGIPLLQAFGDTAFAGGVGRYVFVGNSQTNGNNGTGLFTVLNDHLTSTVHGEIDLVSLDANGNIFADLLYGEGQLIFSLQTTPTVAGTFQKTAQAECFWNNATNAAFAGGFKISANDSVGGLLECARFDTDGSGHPRIGVLGTAPAGQQSASSDLLTSLKAYGLISAGLGTPLNLGTGTLTSQGIQETLTDAGTSVPASLIFLTHHSTLTPAAGFGSSIEFNGDDSANVVKRMGRVTCQWLTPTDGATISQIILSAANPGSFVPVLTGDGTQLVTIPGTLRSGHVGVGTPPVANTSILVLSANNGDTGLKIFPVLTTGTGDSIQCFNAAQTIAVFKVDVTGIVTAAGLSLVDGATAVVGSAGGFKLATSVSQQLGFWNAVPVVQQANASAAGVAGITAGALYAQADMAAVKTALTAIRAGLAANGILANTA